MLVFTMWTCMGMPLLAFCLIDVLRKALRFAACHKKLAHREHVINCNILSGSLVSASPGSSFVLMSNAGGSSTTILEATFMEHRTCSTALMLRRLICNMHNHPM